MEHNQEHVATLCAVGTIGIAAAGLALGTSDGESYLVRPGKRKAPGSVAVVRSPVSPDLPSITRPNTSQPTKSTSALAERIERRLSTTLLRRKTYHEEIRPVSGSTDVQSRESSVSRHGIPRPWTSSDRESSTERKEARPGSSWLRRISSISRGKHGSAASSSSRLDEEPDAARPSFNGLDQPNKLVKRSSSRRILHSDRESPAQTPALLRRPATSHQRSVTLSGMPYTRPITTESALPVESPGYISRAPTWRPFFDSGYARKRYSSSGYGESCARTITRPHGCPATLVMGTSVTPRETIDVEDNRPAAPFSDPVLPTATRRHKMRRPLGSIRKGLPQRHFTDPIVRVNKDEAYGRIVPPAGFSGISPVSNFSAFEVDLPPGTPVFTSSPPPSYGPPQHHFTISKRMSVAPSDPTTASSDNDTRVFTDDDSMDFHSDTAYDSLATRATASSHSGFRQPKIETIFDEMSVDVQPAETAAIEDLMQRATLNDLEQTTNLGIGISGIEEHETVRNVSPAQASTPVKSYLAETEDSVSTPVPKKLNRQGPVLGSSPPLMHPFPHIQHEEPELPRMMDLDDEEDIDWSPKSDENKPEAPRNLVPDHEPEVQFDELPDDDSDEQRSTKRISIFDWSEHQKLGSDQSDGVSPRPKTVHGKQGNNISRSRASGRKSNATMHLRSQSVPVNRDSLTEADLPSSASKFGTWALGSKPVSEEWSDDFEFEDGDEVLESIEVVNEEKEKAKKRDSIRSSVRVPQAIIDRQQSVHIQFGQVREFMLLVEELKRLRVRGISLGLIDSYSRQLWEDAVSIIDLATVNDDEEDAPRPSSPVFPDIFGEETPPQKRVLGEEVGKGSEVSRSVNRRSISSPGTPPYGRPRGESMQTKSFLQTIHQSRTGVESSPARHSPQHRDKLPFDTQDLRDLVVRAGVITRALKEIVRKAEGVSVTPEKPAHHFQDPVFRHIFDPPNSSPSSGFRKPALPKSKSANSYLDGASSNNDHEMPQSLKLSKVVEAN
ncbi:hypothetical protein PV11_09558 [Exophiala sideris]|uniref:Uncharacterized protein n=1 Tax=Exophiala sideris TaxID=1016849 RepID=A0A0D1YS50_9EURO|nr:hypothetical protein PV11_09558 [Exophiala sideris]